MTISSRIHDTLEGWQGEWKDRLRGWMASWITKGGNEFLESAEPQTIDLMRDTLQKMINDPNISPELKKALEKSIEEGDWVAVAFGYLGMIIGSVLGILALGGPPGRIQQYAVERFTHSMRLDPISTITAWRRDPETYNWLFDDLRDQGWTEERIEALKFFTLFYPSPMDLVNWQAKEVFEPNMIAKYGLKDELGELRREDFYKAGMSDEQIDNFWMAHWEHPEFRTVVEMLRRTDFSEDDMKDWFRLVEIPPYWRDKLIEIAWEVPTRVDVRRFYDLKTIDEARLREIYTAMGYKDKNLEDYVLWTKIYVELPDLIARWKNGWITLDQAKSRLVELGMTAAAAEELVQTKVKVEQAEPVVEAKSLTKAEIYKGVKVGRITRAEGVLLLELLEYTTAQAEYLLATNVPEDETVPVVTTRQLTKADILNGLKTAVITREEARTKLLELRYTAADAEFLLKIYDAQVSPPTEPKLKEASKADIVLGVTKGLITQGEGYMMLLELGYSPEAANFVLTVKTEESPFSPANYGEYIDMAEKYRRAAGLEVKTMPEELKQAAAAVLKLDNDVKRLTAEVKHYEDQIIGVAPEPAEIVLERDARKAELANAELSLAEAKTRYETLLARWRHSGQ